MNWAAAATLMTLSVSVRCARDFRYYRATEPESVKHDELVKICHRLRRNSFALQNLMMKELTSSTFPFLFLLGRAIHDDLETLHRDILFFDADQIIAIIPLIDAERNRWKNYNRASFYDEALTGQLDHAIPAHFDRLLAHIRELKQADS